MEEMDGHVMLIQTARALLIAATPRLRDVSRLALADSALQTKTAQTLTAMPANNVSLVEPDLFVRWIKIADIHLHAVVLAHAFFAAEEHIVQKT